tara:strand:+ start:6 stop:644 length:639 start_codon:yes stop_codon:yes gene_type:complete
VANYKTKPLDEDQLWSTMEDKDLLAEDKTALKVAQAAKFKSTQGYDTNIAGRKSFVCLDCVTGILADAEIPVPKTSYIPTFIDALRGHKVQLWNNPKINGELSKQVYKDHVSWQEITDYKDLKSGDVLFVHTLEGGQHAAIVTSLKGEARKEGEDVLNIWGASRNGVNIVHDKGSRYPVRQDFYSFEDLAFGQRDTNNRKFITAFRYNFKEE